MKPTRELSITTVSFEGRPPLAGQRKMVVEWPVAFEFNGLAYAVMLGTPADLRDFAVGFAFAEGFIETIDDVRALDIAETECGVIARLTVPDELAAVLTERVRLKAAEGGCGLCGLQSIAEAVRPRAPLARKPVAGLPAVGNALATMREHQVLNCATGATHAAAFCDDGGRILALREDVGRHNALDKLIGHLLLVDIDPAQGFIVMSARCSYELVDKTVRAGCPMLVTISAPTSLAVERAHACKLTLLALARSDTALVVCDPYGRFG